MSEQSVPIEERVPLAWEFSGASGEKSGEEDQTGEGAAEGIEGAGGKWENGLGTAERWEREGGEEGIAARLSGGTHPGDASDAVGRMGPSFAQTSDEGLVEAICGGNAAALEELWRRYGALLASQALRVLQSSADADDAVAEVFEEVWARPSSYHVERARPVAWLLTLVRRRSIDRLRVRKRHRRVEVWLAAERARAPSCEGGAQDGEWRRAELRDLLARAMHRLPEKQRLTVWLAYYRGCSHREIARETCCPVGTVKTRLESALRKMRDGLSPGRDKHCAEKFSEFC
jgi:RNA polymerase sigma-70 factor (ECF subfamily)